MAASGWRRERRPDDLRAGGPGFGRGVTRGKVRVMTRQGRTVLLTEDKRLFRETVQRTPLLRIIKR